MSVKSHQTTPQDDDVPGVQVVALSPERRRLGLTRTVLNHLRCVALVGLQHSHR